MLESIKNKLVFVKEVNISTFKTGIIIPNKYHEKICSSLKLPMSKSCIKTIRISIDNKLYDAKLSFQATTSTNAFLKIRYDVDSDIAKKLRAKFSPIFKCLNYSIDDFTNIYCLEEETDASIEIYVNFVKNIFIFECLLKSSKKNDIDDFDSKQHSLKISNVEMLFTYFLKTKENLSEKAIDLIIENLNNINQYLASPNNEKNNIFDITDITMIKSLHLALTQDYIFNRTNKEKNNAYSLSIHKYMNFLSKSINAISEEYETDLYKENPVYFNIEKSFFDWLLCIKDLSRLTAQNYISAIYNVMELVFKVGASDVNIFTIKSSSKIEIVNNKLFSNSEFIDKNKNYHNTFSAALNNYYNFLVYIETGEIRKKDNLNPTTLLKPTGLKTAIQYIELSKVELNDEMISIVNVLNSSFESGIKLNSIIQIKKFQNEFARLYPEINLTIDTELIKEKIENVCIDCLNGLFMTCSTIVTDEAITLTILNFILEIFESGKKIIYLENIFKRFNSNLLTTKIYNEDILEQFIEHYLKDDLVFKKGALFRKGAMLTESAAKQNINDEVAEVFSKSDMPLTKDEVFNILSHIPSYKVNSVFGNDSRLICIRQGVYTHIDKLEVTKDDLFLLDDIIRYEIQNGFIAIKKLLEILKVKAEDFVLKNNIIHQNTLRDILKFYFSKEFNFKLTFIGKIGEEMSGVVAVRYFTKDKTEFTLADLTGFLEENELPMRYDLFFNIIKENFIRINNNDFILIKDFTFILDNKFVIESIVRKYLLNGCIPLNAINGFSIFPSVDYKWNIFLLEGIIDNFCTSFEILDYSRSATKSTGIIVDTNKGFNNYDDLLVYLISEQDKKSPIINEDSAINFLFKTGYLTQKRYKNITDVFKTAKIQNIKKEGL